MNGLSSVLFFDVDCKINDLQLSFFPKFYFCISQRLKAGHTDAALALVLRLQGLVLMVLNEFEDQRVNNAKCHHLNTQKTIVC